MWHVSSLATQVNDILNRYILVHNAIFKFSIRKLLPIPGLFKAIDYDSHYQALDNLHSELAQALEAIAQVRASEPASNNTGAFLAALAEYGSAVSDTIGSLRDICSHLYRKSQGATDFSWATYERDNDAYMASVVRYMALGEHLNSLWARLGDAEVRE